MDNNTLGKSDLILLLPGRFVQYESALAQFPGSAWWCHPRVVPPTAGHVHTQDASSTAARSQRSYLEERTRRSRMQAPCIRQDVELHSAMYGAEVYCLVGISHAKQVLAISARSGTGNGDSNTATNSRYSPPQALLSGCLLLFCSILV